VEERGGAQRKPARGNYQPRNRRGKQRAQLWNEVAHDQRGDATGNADGRQAANADGGNGNGYEHR